MSEALYGLGGLRFWNEQEIQLRDHLTKSLVLSISTKLQSINSAWTFHQIEGPLLTPSRYINSSYDENDIFMLKAKLAENEASLRAETTASSYLYAEHLLKTTRTKPPLCVWQVGKSFRRETTDGARASTLRFNEFYQLEFQCIYSSSTKADYKEPIYKLLQKDICNLTLSDTSRAVSSDRLPSYSKETMDIEVLWNGLFKEMCSISSRIDFGVKDTEVLEIAIGLDRLISVYEINSAK